MSLKRQSFNKKTCFLSEAYIKVYELGIGSGLPCCMYLAGVSCPVLGSTRRRGRTCAAAVANTGAISLSPKSTFAKRMPRTILSATMMRVWTLTILMSVKWWKIFIEMGPKEEGRGHTCASQLSQLVKVLKWNQLAWVVDPDPE